MTESQRDISILLACDDSQVVSDKFVSVFKKTEDLKLVCCAATMAELLLKMKEFHPMVLLVDISITSEPVAALLGQITIPDTRVLVISPDRSSTFTIEALRFGASGVIGRKTTSDVLCRSVRTVASGDIWIGRGMTAELVEFLRNRSVLNEDGSGHSADSKKSANDQFSLTKREMQIVCALVEAQTNRDIAETYGISEYTVKHHLTNIFDKLGVYNRVELALFAISHRICPGGIAHAYGLKPADSNVQNNGNPK